MLYERGGVKQEGLKVGILLSEAVKVPFEMVHIFISHTYVRTTYTIVCIYTVILAKVGQPQPHTHIKGGRDLQF